MDPVGHPHPVQEVPDRQGQRVPDGGDHPHRLDLGRRDRRAPVREQVGDRAVELLVAHAPRHQQVGVELALGETGAQVLGVGEEAVPVGDDQALGRGHLLPPGLERRERGHLAERRVGDQHRDLAAGGLDLVGEVAGRARVGQRVEVVVAGVAAELVEQEVGVVGGDQDDGGLHRASIRDRQDWCRCASGSTSPTTGAASAAGPSNRACAPCRATSSRLWRRCCGCPRSAWSARAGPTPASTPAARSCTPTCPTGAAVGPLLRRLNGVLGPDVRVRRVLRAPEGFDARFSARWRRYAYRVADDPSLLDPLSAGARARVAAERSTWTR